TSSQFTPEILTPTSRPYHRSSPRDCGQDPRNRGDRGNAAHLGRIGAIGVRAVAELPAVIAAPRPYATVALQCHAVRRARRYRRHSRNRRSPAYLHRNGAAWPRASVRDRARPSNTRPELTVPVAAPGPHSAV